MLARLRRSLLASSPTLGFVATAVLARWLLDPWLGSRLPFATLYAAVALTVWSAGPRSALLATVLGYLACNPLFIEPRGMLGLKGPDGLIGLSLYLLCCGLITAVGAAIRTARRRAAVRWSEASEHRNRPRQSVIGPPHYLGAEASRTARTRRRILIVDDNRDAALSLGMLLQLMGYETRTAHDGLEGVQSAAAFEPDVVLLDIGMPKMNGYEAARYIRQQPWGRHLLLVAVTGWGQEEDKRRALQAGFDRHFTKPVEPRVLEELLGKRTLGGSPERDPASHNN